MNRNLDNDHILHYVWGADFPKLVRGEGIYLYDVNGKRYIDGLQRSRSAAAFATGRKDMAQALYDQASTLAYALRHITTSQVLEEATDKMAEDVRYGSILPGIRRYGSQRDRNEAGAHLLGAKRQADEK